MFLSMGPGKLIVTQRQGNRSYRTYYGLQVPESFFRDGTVDLQDVEATRRMLLTDFYSDWSVEYHNLIRHATDFRGWLLHTLSTEDMGWKSVPGVTLAGDAAHLAIANGEGVNLAMTDSMKLASKIVEHGVESIDQAVREYEEEMFPRGVASITAGKMTAEGMFGGDPEGFMRSVGADHEVEAA